MERRPGTATGVADDFGMLSLSSTPTEEPPGATTEPAMRTAPRGGGNFQLWPENERVHPVARPCAACGEWKESVRRRINVPAAPALCRGCFLAQSGFDRKGCD